MTRAEYQTYESTVADFFTSEGIDSLSPIADNEGDYESYFSATPCECCNRPLGGDRYQASGYNPETRKILEYSVCPDCLYYAEYGQLDDMTMMDMEEDNAELFYSR